MVALLYFARSRLVKVFLLKREGVSDHIAIGTGKPEMFHHTLHSDHGSGEVMEHAALFKSEAQIVEFMTWAKGRG